MNCEWYMENGRYVLVFSFQGCRHKLSFDRKGYELAKRLAMNQQKQIEITEPE